MAGPIANTDAWVQSLNNRRPSYGGSNYYTQNDKHDIHKFILLGDSSGLIMEIAKMSPKLGVGSAERSRQFGDVYRHRFAVIGDITYVNITY